MPTYRNDGVVTYRINNINDMVEDVVPGASVQTFDREIPTDFTLTSALPTLQRTIAFDVGADVFTSAIKPKGPFNVSVSGEFTGTVRLEKSFDNFTDIIDTMYTYNVSLGDICTDNDPNASYRLGVRNGELTAGAVTVILSK